MDYPNLAMLRAGSELPEALAALSNQILEDVPWVRSNGISSHQITIRIEPPKIDYIKTSCPQVSFGLGRAADETSLIHQIFYGNTWKDPNEATGLSEYFGTMNNKRAQNSTNVIDGAGRGACVASIYLVCWSPKTVYIAWNTDGEGKLLAAIIPEDWRYIVRIANIDTESRDLDLVTAMSRAILFVPKIAMKPIFYMGSAVRRMFAEQIGNEHTSVLRGVPIQHVPVLHSKEKHVE